MRMLQQTHHSAAAARDRAIVAVRVATTSLAASVAVVFPFPVDHKGVAP